MTMKFFCSKEKDKELSYVMTILKMMKMMKMMNLLSNQSTTSFFKKEDDNNNDNDEDNNNNVDNTNNNTSDNAAVGDDDNDNDEEDEDLIHHLSHFSQQLQNVPVTWGDEPQSPWSEHEDHVEQNHVIVPTITEPVVIPYMYTPEGVVFLLFCHLHYLFLVSYKARNELPILWSHVQESMLSGMLPLEVYKQLGRDFYLAFNGDIKHTHLLYTKQLYGFTDEHLSRSHELDESFVQF
jgi:hypothetical protein